MAKARFPLDRRSYARDPRSRPIHVGLGDGTYVYVQDTARVIYVLPDGPHLHPRVLGGGRPAIYAGDFTIESDKKVDLTNLSGTFRFEEPEGLTSVARTLRQLGFTIVQRAVRLFPTDGSRPYILDVEP